MKVYVINDTSAYHCGSWAVCEFLGRAISDKGHHYRFEASKKIIEKDAIAECDAVLVNGEGTLHDNTKRSIRILAALDFAQGLKKITGICNASWFGMTNEYDHVLKRLDHFSIRESLSKKQLLESHGVTPSLALDLSYWFCQAPAAAKPRTDCVLRTDLYSPEFRTFVSPTGGQLAKIAEIRMSSITWTEMLQATQTCATLLTGRHHGMYAACVTRTPFVALQGNTPKIEGLIAWSGIDIPFAREARQLITLLRQSRKLDRAYHDFFDWMQAQPEWKFPF